MSWQREDCGDEDNHSSWFCRMFERGDYQEWSSSKDCNKMKTSMRCLWMMWDPDRWQCNPQSSYTYWHSHTDTHSWNTTWRNRDRQHWVYCIVLMSRSRTTLMVLSPPKCWNFLFLPSDHLFFIMNTLVQVSMSLAMCRIRRDLFTVVHLVSDPSAGRVRCRPYRWFSSRVWVFPGRSWSCNSTWTSGRFLSFITPTPSTFPRSTLTLSVKINNQGLFFMYSGSLYPLACKSD
jgi:hypothetical protein